MARVCQLCGKGPKAGNRISHAHNVTKRRWEVNLQAVRVQAASGSGARRMRLCTACIKSGDLPKPMKRIRPAAKAV